MKTNKNKLLKTNRNKLLKTNKPNTRNHTRKHRTTCNEVKFWNDANNANAELRAKCDVWLCYCIARFIVQSEGNANNKYFASVFFQTIHAGNAASGPWLTNDQCGKTIVQGTMDAGINNVIYMELHSGPKMANGTCGKTIVAGTIDRGSTVCLFCFICSDVRCCVEQRQRSALELTLSYLL